MKRNLAILAMLILCFVFAAEVAAQRKLTKAKLGKICGNPKIKCRTGELTFQAHEISFEIPRGNQIIFESEPFYTILLKSVKL